MPENKVLDRYYLELEMTETRGLPVRAMATNTADEEKTAETWWSLEMARASLLRVMPLQDVEYAMQQLEDNRHVVMLAAHSDRAIFVSPELVSMGFSADDVDL